MRDDHYSIITSILHLIYSQHMFQLALPFYGTLDLCLLVPETSKKVSCIRISKILVHNPNEDYIFSTICSFNVETNMCLPFYGLDKKKSLPTFFDPE